MFSKDTFSKAQDERNKENLEESLRLYQEARQIAKQEGDPWISTESLHMIGLIYWQMEKYDLAKKSLGEAKQEFADTEAFVVRDMANVAYTEKKFNEAEKLSNESVDLLKNSYRRDHLGISLVHHGKALAALGKSDEAEKEIKQGISEIEKTDNKFFQATGYDNLAKVQKTLGQIEESRQSIQKSLRLLDEAAPPNHHQKLRQERQKFLEELKS